MSALQSQRLTCLATHSAVMPTHSVNRETGNTLENSYITLPPQHTKAHGHTHTHKLQKSAGLLQPNILFFLEVSDTSVSLPVNMLSGSCNAGYVNAVTLMRYICDTSC